MRDPVNKARGEVLLEIDGRPRRLCVTLGALAELEGAFDVASLAELGERLAHLTAADLIIVVGALSGMSTDELARAELDPKTAASAVADAFRIAFDD
jgi:hypothetical protein